MKHLQRATLIVVLLIPGALKVAAVDFERMQNVLSQRFGPAAAGQFLEWQKLLKDRAAQAGPAQLKQGNDFFNRRIKFDENRTIQAQSAYRPMSRDSSGSL